jgi:hypothetical protein
MRVSKMLIALTIAATISIPMAMAKESDSKTTPIWPSDQRAALSREQVSIGLRLAGSEMHDILGNGQRKGGVRDAFDYCVLGKYKFRQETLFSTTGFLQSSTDPDIFSPVIIANSSNVYLNSNLEPEQARAISVDFAETVLNRKLDEIDPKDPDTLFDPRDLDLMHLFFRATQKVQGAVTQTCSSEEEASFRNGKPTSCTYGPFFVKKNGEYDYTLLTRIGDRPVISGYFGGGNLLMDATISDADKIDRVEHQARKHHWHSGSRSRLRGRPAFYLGFEEDHRLLCRQKVRSGSQHAVPYGCFHELRSRWILLRAPGWQRL